MMSRARWLAGWGLLAATYVVLAVVRVVAHGDWDGAAVYGVAALVTFGFAAAVIPWVLPRRGPDDGSGGGGGGPEGDEPPPWWPDFERQFWGYQQRLRACAPRAGARIGAGGITRHSAVRGGFVSS